LPLIKCFTSEAVNEEDWKEIQEAVGLAAFDRDEIKVSMFAENNLYEFVPRIEEITMKAEKKFSLQQQLKGMKDEMKNYMLEQKDYKGVTKLIKGYDDINGQLDDQIVKTQAMLGSSHIGKGKLRTETKKWVDTLNSLSELVEQMLKTQRTWMYLEPIFSSGDIMNTMPLEAKMFNEVDALWKATMKGIEEEPAIMELAPDNNAEIFSQFMDSNKKLDKIQKSLSDYLEQKRLVFARFFFLANEDLL
jgi:dynein heavy chain